MGNSPLVSYTKISENKTSPRNHVIDTVTIHCYVGQVTVESAGSWFTHPNCQASCNYAIGYDGKIALIVDEKDRSWCSSNGANDHRAITIEVASDMKHPYVVKPAAYNALIDLLVDICKRNPAIGTLKWKGDKSLIGQPDKQNMTVHKWFDNKDCPGEYLYSRHAQIAAEVNARLGATENKSDETPAEKPKVINVGDIVYIRPGATYYNGLNIPVWVRRKNWIVKSVDGDRVIIDKSEDGKNGIFSPIHRKYLILVKSNTNNTTTPTATIKAGDTVSICTDAKWYNGTDVPYWVQKKKWIVKSVNGDRVVVDKSADGKNAICSPIHSKYLTVTQTKSDLPYMVLVDIDNLNIRKGPGTSYDTNGVTGKGVFTIVEVKSGWGKLKSGVGWISLEHTKRI